MRPCNVVVIGAGLCSCISLANVFKNCWLWVWSSVAWLSGLGLSLGLAGQRCGIKMIVGFPLANFVVVGLGCVHVLVCAWFPLCVVAWCDVISWLYRWLGCVFG